MCRLKKWGRFSCGFFLFVALGFVQTVAAQTLEWSTYFPASGSAIAVDDSGNVYITGSSNAKSIATPGAHQEKTSQLYLVKFNKAGKRVWGTYYAGGGGSVAISLDNIGNIVITGYVSPSNNFYDDRIVTTPGAYQEKFTSPPNAQQKRDAFIAKFSNSGKLIWATLYGGNKNEHGAAVAIDKKNNIYIAGQTYSDTGIASPYAHQVKFTGDVPAL